MTEQTASEKIIDRVRKLMALTEDHGANENEAKLAMVIANRLMGEHHLTEEDLVHEPDEDYRAVDKAEYGARRAFVGLKIYAWESHLSMFVADFVGIPVYRDDKLRMVRRNGFVVMDEHDKPTRGKTYVYFGVDEDAKIAVDLYAEMRATIATMAVARYGQVYKKDGGVYAEGFVAGLADQIKAARKAAVSQPATMSNALILTHRQNDLVQYKKTKATEWLKTEKGITLGTGRGSAGASGSGAAHRAGFRDGRNSSVSAKRSAKLNG